MQGAFARAVDNSQPASYTKIQIVPKEQVHHQRYATRDQAKADIFDYIECFYNTIRRHSALGNRSPLDFTASFASDSKTNAI
jgi:putative transposase